MGPNGYAGGSFTTPPASACSSPARARSRVSAGVVEEDETTVTEAEYADLLARTDPARRTVVKTRWVVPHGGHQLEIDRIVEPRTLWLLEIELPDTAQLGDAVVLPAWLGRDRRGHRRPGVRQPDARTARTPRQDESAVPGRPLSEVVDPGWATALAPVADDIARMGDFLREEVVAGRGYLPAGENVLRAFSRPLRRRARARRRARTRTPLPGTRWA